jgi:glycosyltransferase involved in cell wall biosynthesis
MTAARPLVSVLIPTADRPVFVLRAVRSALAQTVRDLEVVVVVDGPGEETQRALREVGDPRLRVATLPRRLGEGGARNAGLAEASGEWVAFLDDDDEWLPEKLELQLEAARSSASPDPVITCRVIARGAGPDFVWPRRPPRQDEPLSEYLLLRRSVFAGQQLIQPSTLLFRARLGRKVRYRTGLPRHTDWEWLLRAERLDGVAIEFVRSNEPLAVWSIDEHRPRVSAAPDWHGSLVSLRDFHDLLTARAYGSSLLTMVGRDAARARSWKALWSLPLEAFRRGRPAALDVLLFLGVWLIPSDLSRRVRGLLWRGLPGPE